MSEITELSALEYRCVMAAVAVPDDNELGPDYSAIVRAVLAEAGVDELREAIEALLQSHRAGVGQCCKAADMGIAALAKAGA